MPHLRLLVYDATKHDPLSLAWRGGSALYRGVRAIHRARGVRSWAEALGWLATVQPAVPIDEIQYWGHGKWGCAFVGDDRLDAAATEPGHPLYVPLVAVRARLARPDALWWWRTCETFGADRGLAFAARWASFLGCRTAGHTHVIGAWQSGLHVLGPGQVPAWSPTEGLAEGTAAVPVRALDSRRRAPATIHFLTTRLPDRFSLS